MMLMVILGRYATTYHECSGAITNAVFITFWASEDSQGDLKLRLFAYD